jgi:hypothetical protein
MADKKNINIGVGATDEGASDVINKVNRATQKMADDAEKSSKKTGEAIGGVGQAGKKAAADVEESSKKAEKSLDDVGEAGKKAGADISAGMKQGAASTDIISEGMEKLRNRFTEIDQWADRMQKNFAGVRNIGLGISALSFGAILLSNKLSKVSEESDHASQSLEDMARKRGDGGRIEELDNWAKKLAYDTAQVNDGGIKTAAGDLYSYGLSAEQIMKIMPDLIGRARQYHQDLSSVAQQFGKSFEQGDPTGLVQAGFHIDPGTADRISEINDLTQRQQAILEAVSESARKYGLGLTEGMSEAEVAANRTAQVLDEFYSNIGRGTDYMRVKMGQGAAVVVGFANHFPLLETAIGNVIGFLGYFGGAAGALLTTLGTVGQGITGAIEIWNKGKAVLGFLRGITLEAAAAEDVLAASTETEAAAAGDAAIATTGEAAATAAAGEAAEAATLSIGGLTVSIGILLAELALIVIAIEGFRMAWYGTIDAMKESDKELEYKYGLLGKLWVLLSKIGNSLPVRIAVDILDGNWGQIKNDISGALDEGQNGPEYQMYVKRAKEHGWQVKSYADWSGNPTASDAASGDTEAAARQSIDAQQAAPAPQYPAAVVPPQYAAPQYPAAVTPGAAPINTPLSPKDRRKKDREEEQLAREKQRHEKAMEKLRNQSPDYHQRKKANEQTIAMGQMMAKAMAAFAPNGGKPYSTINADGTVTEYPGVGQMPAPQQKITLKPKNRVSQNSAGDYKVEILPETFIIPNPFGRAVEALG